MKILIIGCEGKLSSSLLQQLRLEGHEMYALTAEDAPLAPCGYDMVLLDFTRPDAEGCERLKSIKALSDAPPVILLAENAATETLTNGILSGADDFITIPVSLPELCLMMSVCMHVRRNRSGSPADHPPSLTRVGQVEIDFGCRQIRRGNERIDMSAQESALIECLVKSQGQPLTKQAILERLWLNKRAPRSNATIMPIDYVDYKGPLNAGDRASLQSIRANLTHLHHDFPST
jgi:DNA-binding response OmpR family regulator